MVPLGWSARITADLGPPTLFYAVSQAALAIEVRADDAQARALCRTITHWPTEWACFAERACLRVLEGGCSVPVAVHTTHVPAEYGAQRGRLCITGVVTSLGGERLVEHTIEEEVGSLEEAEAVGARLAKVLVETGAKEIPDEINVDSEKRVAEAKANDEEINI